MTLRAFIYHRVFAKQYAKLDKRAKAAFKERRNLLMIDREHPLLDDHPLNGKWEGCRSINVSGDLRAIYKPEGYIAIFLEIGTHSILYKG